MMYTAGCAMNEEKATAVQISMAKRNKIEIAASAGSYGSNGCSRRLSNYEAQMNLESLVTYRGTQDIHLLILSADISWIQEFS